MPRERCRDTKKETWHDDNVKRIGDEWRDGWCETATDKKDKQIGQFFLCPNWATFVGSLPF